jgi:hypothetical protein
MLGQVFSDSLSEVFESNFASEQAEKPKQIFN